MTLTMRFGAYSDIGRSRKKNDDSGYAGPRLIMVADGMGGAAAGDLASAVAVQTMRRLDEAKPNDLLEALAGAVQRANDRLAELIDDDPAVEGMGTTVIAVLFDGTKFGIAHLGDSRAYLWHAGQLRRITHDHTWVQSLIDDGRITEAEARVHSHRSLLLKVLDGKHDNDPDLTLHDVEAGDRILLCSDGLSSFVSEEQIAQVMSVGTPDSVARELTQLALDSASTDNITVLVGDVVDGPPTEAEPIVVGSAAEPMKRSIGRRRGWGHRVEPNPEDGLFLEPDSDPEELRYAPRPPRRLLWLRRTATLLVVLGLLAWAAYAGYGWTQQQYYVAAAGGNVAIYQGIQSDVPGVSLHHVYARQPLKLSQLPSFRRSQVVQGLTAEDLPDAHRIVRQLIDFANACAHRAAGSSTSPPVTNPPSTGPTIRATTKSAGPTTGPKTRPTTGATTPATTPTTNEATPTSTQTNAPAGAPTGAQECAGATPTTTVPTP